MPICLIFAQCGRLGNIHRTFVTFWWLWVVILRLLVNIARAASSCHGSPSVLSKENYFQISVFLGQPVMNLRSREICSQIFTSRPWKLIAQTEAVRKILSRILVSSELRWRITNHIIPIKLLHDSSCYSDASKSKNKFGHVYHVWECIGDHANAQQKKH